MFLEFYGLDEQPFGVTPDPRFLYMGSAQREAFSSLVYGIETGRGFMALIAYPGLGKTTLLLHLMEHLRESARTALLFQTFTNPQDFLRTLLLDLGAEPAGPDLGDLHRQLGNLLIQETQSGKRIVVAIDEAQNLTLEILEMVRMLSNFETPQSKLIQIVLVGQPQLAEMLASPKLEQFRQRISIVSHYVPFDAADVPKYIDHRLRVAGYKGGDLFTAAAMRVLVAQSKGIPRNINNLCFQAMSLGFALNKRKIDEKIMLEVISDLNLESLSAAPVETSGAAANGATGVKSPQKQASARQVSAQQVLPHKASEEKQNPTSSRPMTGEANGLDEIDLSADGRSEEFDAFRYSPNLSPPGAPQTFRGQHHGAGMAALLGLSALLVWLCSGGRLRSDIGYFMGSQVDSGLISSRNQATRKDYSLANLSEPVPQPNGPEAQTVENTLNAQPLSPAPATRVSAMDSQQDEAGKGRLVVESSISGAQITLNGERNPLWVTPRYFSLASGTYIVSVTEPGHEPWTRRVHVDEGQERWVNADLPARYTDGGIFTVDTDPPGMQIFIDDKAFGPSRVEAILKPGWHVCAVIPGPGLKPLVRRFHLNAGESVTRRIRVIAPPMSQTEPKRPESESNDEAMRIIPEGGNP